MNAAIRCSHAFVVLLLVRQAFLSGTIREDVVDKMMLAPAEVDGNRKPKSSVRSIEISKHFRGDQSYAGSDVPQGIHQIGITKYDEYAATTEAPKNSLPVVMLVHHRETFFACHSFERFLSPRWMTIFVLEEELVDRFDIRRLATFHKHQGVRIATTGGVDTTGEWLGRQVALRIMKKEGITTPLILSAHCDIHPLPTWHDAYVPHEKIVEEFVYAFLEEDEQNRHHNVSIMNDFRSDFHSRFADICYTKFERATRPLLSMSTIMLETIPFSNNFNRSRFHAHDAGLECPWKECPYRPKRLKSNERWISDSTTWFEDHFVMYNVSMLSQIVDVYATMYPTLGKGHRSLTEVACAKDWKLARLNDVVLHYDLAKPLNSIHPNGTKIPLYNPQVYGHIPTDWLFSRSLISLSKVQSPFGCQREYMGMTNYIHVTFNYPCNIFFLHLHPEHIPKMIWKEDIGSNEMVFGALMRLHGYIPVKSDESRIVYLSLSFEGQVGIRSFTRRLGSRSKKSGVTALPHYRPALNGPEWQIITLKKTFRPNLGMFFTGTNPLLENTSPSNEYYRDLATTICSWRDAGRVDPDSGPLTREEILTALAPFEKPCGLAPFGPVNATVIL